STVCDSVEAKIRIRNTSCGQVVLSNVTSSSPITILSFAATTLLSDSTTELIIRFVPSNPGAQQYALTIDATIGNDDFDTTLTINATATEGDLVLNTSSDILEFDSVSTCSQVTLPLALTNAGCAAVVISNSTIDGGEADFFIAKNVSDPNMLRGDTDTLWITFKPSNVGDFTRTLRIMTNAGERTITLHGYGREDRGQVVLAMTGTLQTELCTHQDFNVRIANGTCDDVTVDSIVVLGDVADFVFPNTGQQGIKTGDAYDLFGQFIPTSAGPKKVRVRVHYTDALGSYIKEIEIDALGTSSPPLFASLPADSVMQAMILSDIQMPVYVSGLSNSEIQTVEFSLALKTDLLTPIFLDLNGTEMSGANVSQFAVANDSVSIRLTFPTPRRIGEGILSRINFRTFVTDTLSTQVRLLRFSAAGTQEKCLATAIQSIGEPPVFHLDPQCGEQFVSQYMSLGELPSITSITPNPSNGKVTVKLRTPNAASDAAVSVYDLTGRVVLEQPIPERASEIRLDINHGAGQYFIRVHSSLGSSTRSVVVRK
ncbi:MAG TPA: T9SS type A sorting domain-containing protein, partial [Candidatus Kapabacteria bacterium]|nr:T9SS type A sorting domain-containing protein [Candidatus Kapabacteria bacterium]